MGQTEPDSFGSGRGLQWLSGKQKWQASIRFKGRRYDLGCYARFEDAVEVCKQAQTSLRDAFLGELVAEVLSSMPSD